jgi:hypothetical protein
VVFHWHRGRHRNITIPEGRRGTLESSAGSSRKQAVICASILLPLAVAAICASVWFSGRIGGSDMDRHGYVALAIGVVATLGLGIGLMGLVFYSSRHGYDESAR